MLTLGGAIGLACGIWVEALTGHVPSTYVFAGNGSVRGQLFTHTDYGHVFGLRFDQGFAGLKANFGGLLGEFSDRTPV